MSFSLKAKQELVRSFDSENVTLNRLIKIIILDGALTRNRIVVFCPSDPEGDITCRLDYQEYKLPAHQATYQDFHELLLQLRQYSIVFNQTGSFTIRHTTNPPIWSITFDHTSPTLFGDLISLAQFCSRQLAKQTTNTQE